MSGGGVCPGCLSERGRVCRKGLCPEGAGFVRTPEGLCPGRFVRGLCPEGPGFVRRGFVRGRSCNGARNVSFLHTAVYTSFTTTLQQTTKNDSHITAFLFDNQANVIATAMNTFSILVIKARTHWQQSRPRQDLEFTLLSICCQNRQQS